MHAFESSIGEPRYSHSRVHQWEKWASRVIAEANWGNSSWANPQVPTLRLKMNFPLKLLHIFTILQHFTFTFQKLQGFILTFKTLSVWLQLVHIKVHAWVSCLSPFFHWQKLWIHIWAARHQPWKNSTYLWYFFIPSLNLVEFLSKTWKLQTLNWTPTL